MLQATTSLAIYLPPCSPCCSSNPPRGIACYDTKHGGIPCLGNCHYFACRHPNLVDNFNHLALCHLLSASERGNLLFSVPSYIPCADLMDKF